jgi:hypothetical protein
LLNSLSINKVSILDLAIKAMEFSFASEKIDAAIAILKLAMNNTEQLVSANRLFTQFSLLSSFVEAIINSHLYKTLSNQELLIGIHTYLKEKFKNLIGMNEREKLSLPNFKSTYTNVMCYAIFINDITFAHYLLGLENAYDSTSLAIIMKEANSQETSLWYNFINEVCHASLSNNIIISHEMKGQIIIANIMQSNDPEYKKAWRVFELMSVNKDEFQKINIKLILSIFEAFIKKNELSQAINVFCRANFLLVTPNVELYSGTINILIAYKCPFPSIYNCYLDATKRKRRLPLEIHYEVMQVSKKPENINFSAQNKAIEIIYKKS